MGKHLNSSSFQRQVEHSVGGGVGVGFAVARALMLVVPPTAAPAEAAAAALSASRSYTTRGERRMSTRRLNSSSVRRLYAREASLVVDYAPRIGMRILIGKDESTRIL